MSDLINAKSKDLREAKVEERNMSYVRFENTYKDLLDCFEHLNDEDLSASELKYRNLMVDMCKEIVDDAEMLDSPEDDDE